nr:methyltransferase [Propionicimonas sp.]
MTGRLPLADSLERLGLAELIESLPSGRRTPSQCRFGLLGCASPPLKRLLRLFVLGGVVPLAELPAEVVDGLGPLCDAGFCSMTGDSASLAGLTLTRVEGLWYLSEMPSAGQTLYFGPDSLALINRLGVPRGPVLDLCSGPGIIGLVAAQRRASVTAVEINPMAVSLSMLNARLNGLDDDYEPRLGDLYAPILPGERFDLVAANPPLVPVPDGLAYGFVGNGGPDGMDVTWRILSGLAGVLSPTGVAQTLGVTLASKGEVLGLPRLREIAGEHGLHVQMTIAGRVSTNPEGAWCRGMAWTILATEGRGAGATAHAALAEELSVGYRAAGADEVVFYYLRVGLHTPGVAVASLARSSPDESAGGWYLATMNTD